MMIKKFFLEKNKKNIFQNSCQFLHHADNCFRKVKDNTSNFLIVLYLFTYRMSILDTLAT